MANNWTRDQLLIAINLYCQLPFGRLHKTNPLIIVTAHKIGRTPSALAMKLCNFASLDPEIIGNGRKGLAGASNLDREIWAEFTQDPETIGYQSQLMVDQLAQHDAALSSLSSEVEPTDISNHYYGEDVLVQAKARVKQAFFRKAVLSSYEHRCCITGLAEPKLLVASHIVPWSKDERNRLNPANGLCLSALHDKEGLLTIRPDFTICVSERLLTDQSQLAKDYFWRFNGEGITLPNKFNPDPSFLAYHAEHVFIS
ncbi:HNH endonuclease [Chitinilyticum piscinae]|uniref:HNH endonuclease n=1 Tax=Chitinilyticum piscinae TaxID=2866724 RepID=A0A8J7FIY6_9NEIS|nr:HNH endonuclease [Chitinilyticum piscinae]MBE9607799.1 HNH endonuclease [Chitinilyticum piscinae]